MALQSGSYALTPIATNDGRFTGFAPYVAAIDDDGVVAFQATLADGHSGVFRSDGRSIADVAVTASAACPARLFASHPDINRAGQLAVYGRLENGDEALLQFHPDGRVEVTQAGDGLRGIGPLGPTMNERGDVAVRGTSHDGQACVRLWRGGRFHVVADAGERLRGFEGLPVVVDDGRVAFRANLDDDRQGIFVQQGAQRVAVATTGGDLEEIGRFPSMNGRGVVAFAARRSAGAWGIFTVAAGRTDCVVDAGAGFESLRGILINDAGPVVFYGTPVGGQLGIQAGPDPIRHRILGLGDGLFGATVVDFALNPVSVNERGQLAIRVALEDGREYILRGDPQG
jgi:hypothetical protein